MAADTTTTDPGRHLWVTAPSRRRREQLLSASRLSPVLASVDAHRRLRGPYTAAGTLLRKLAPETLRRWPELVARHDVEVLAVAPELRDAVPCARETLTSLAPPEERTRFYPRARTTRLAHGLTEFLTELLRRTARGPLSLLVENVDHADGTDAELLMILLRRMDPRLLQVVVCSGGGDLWGDLGETLARYATAVVDHGEAPPAEDEEDQHQRAARYVASECTSDEPLLREAYEALPAADRAALHDARAAELEARDELSLRLGAIPFHRERGSDPAGAGADALATALEHCVLLGFYEAVIDLGRRSFALLDWDQQPERCWLVTAKMSTAFSVFDRPDEAAELYDAACAHTTLPSVHLQAAYGQAMLYTRFYEAARRDHRKAKAWINTAIAISSLLPEGQRRAYNLTFQENGLALIEMHLGDLNEALRLVTEGLDRLDRELDPGQQTLHRSVLRYNRAQLLARMGPPEQALRCYDEVIEADPNHSEYYFERAGVHRRMGHRQEAIADYETAMALSPPYPEPYYNRGDLKLEDGDLDGALADFSYVLELDPSFVDAYVNRASIRYQLGDLEAAAADVAAGLAVDPDQPHLLCTRGLIAQERGRKAEAREAFDVALAHDPSLAAAWSNRAVLSFDEGDVDAAISDLSRALDLGDDPAIRGNRGLAYQHAGRWSDAIADYTAALRHAEADRGELLYQRGVCHVRRDDRRAARADFEHCLTVGGFPHADQARRELQSLDGVASIADRVSRAEAGT